MSSDHHGHDHGHSHTHRPSEGTFGSLFRVLLLSGTFMVAEVLGGMWSGSLALLADSGHMAIDTAAVGLGLFALWVGRKPPNDQRTYGYYRAEILAATLNGALLVVVSLWIFYEAIHRFNEPHAIVGSWMTIIAVGGLIVNLVGLRLVHKHADSSLNMRAVTLHLIFDALGSVGAIIAGILVWKWDLIWADSAVSVLIAALILHGAYKLLTECVDILLESVPRGVNLESLRQDLSSIKSVTDVHDLHVWSLATGVVALSAHLKVSDDADHALVLHESTEMLHDKHQIHHATLQLEPRTYSHEDTILDCQKTS
jgi:cobalt-zinc-cadmium efflux system protein